MREIKFRAWDKKDKKWVSTNIVLDYSGLLYWSFGETLQLIDDKERYEVVLYTGLKDKNGKEIYEGGILRLDSWSEIQEIQFVEGAFCMKSINEKHGFLNDIHYIHHAGIPQSEVIGNIWENKELLQDK